MSAQWICHPADRRDNPLVPIFRRTFEVQEGVVKARLRITAHGIFEASLNGCPITDERFAPGLTSYYARIQVREYDLGACIHAGRNVFEATVGDGWWRWQHNFGSRLGLWCEIAIEYADGTRTAIESDSRFQVACSPVVSCDLRGGEIFDARIVPHGWQQAEMLHEHTEGALIGSEGPAVTEHERFAGKPFRDAAGRLVIDFGQNICGMVHMVLHDTVPGQKIVLVHGEGLDLEGNFSCANCDGGHSPFQRVEYICRGARTEEYAPHFAYFGFRYALVEGLREGQRADFESVALYSDMVPAGSFSCSSPEVTKLWENALWSLKGNFLDVPVDCPTRERNAWTGDAMVFCRTAAYLMDVEGFFRKWLVDQTLEQYASGKVGITFPSTSSVHDPQEFQRIAAADPAAAMAGPSGNGNIGEDSVGWGDSAVWIPYQMYLMYGNRGFLEEHYGTAKRWLEYSLRCMKDANPALKDKPWYQDGEGEWIYDTRFHYGEWNEPLPPDPEVIELFAHGGTPEDYVRLKARLGEPEVATAYTKRSCDNMAHMVRILGHAEDAQRYEALSKKIQAAYDRYLIAEDGTIRPGHQAPYVRALAFGLAGPKKRPLVVARLKEEIARAGCHLNTGFLSTVYLLPVLCENGMRDEAFRILEQKGCPGWLHEVELGATTMLERWDGMDSFRDSFNHYSLGSVCQFLYEYVAGIRPSFEGPGFRTFRLEPTIGGTLTWARAEHRVRYGTIASGWERHGTRFVYRCSVPEGTRAHLVLPDGTRHELRPGTYSFEGELDG